MKTSSSDDPANRRQQGETFTVLVNKMMGRKILRVEDKTELGRWSYIQVAGKDKKIITIITGYIPCVQHNPGDDTVTAQQIRILKQMEKETSFHVNSGAKIWKRK